MTSLLRLFCTCLLWVGLLMPALAQSNKLIKELEGKRTDLQRQMSETETLLRTTKRDVGSQLGNLALLTGQIEERQRYIQTINADMKAIDAEMGRLDRRLQSLQDELSDKRQKYAASLQFMRRTSSIEEKLLFIFSADNLAQSYRRLRYIREYTDFLKRQGRQIVAGQEEVRQKQAELLLVKAAQDSLLKERQAEQTKLEAQQKEQKALVAGLQKKQRGLQNEIRRMQQEADKLNAQIDRLVAEEIEKARKRAEEEARREAARRKAESATADKPSGTTRPEPVDAYTMDAADRKLSGDFASNRGKLPVPITGPYVITGHFGRYAVKGLRNVRLDNKGIDFQGRPGAQARAIFQGRVAAVFQLNGLFNVLIRHGAYISVYCNLASATVNVGDQVETGQRIGPVASDVTAEGRTVLHFQLRKEKEKLNPEPWLSR